MGDGCHVMTPDCVTMLLPPPPSQHLHNPIFRGRSSVWTSAQKWGRENKLSLSLLLLITSWHNVGNKKIWRALTVLLISWRKNCTENDISNLSVSLYFLFYDLSNTDDNIDNYSFSLHYTTLHTILCTTNSSRKTIEYFISRKYFFLTFLSSHRIFLTLAASKGEYIS